MAAFVLAMLPVHAQVSTPANNGGATDFVGWDNTMVNDPLQIRHDANQPIDWYTNAIQRLRLNPNLTGSLGQFTNINRDGFMLLSGAPDAFTNAGSRAFYVKRLRKQANSSWYGTLTHCNPACTTSPCFSMASRW